MWISWQSVTNKGRHIKIYYTFINTDKAFNSLHKKICHENVVIFSGGGNKKSSYLCDKIYVDDWME